MITTDITEITPGYLISRGYKESNIGQGLTVYEKEGADITFDFKNGALYKCWYRNMEIKTKLINEILTLMS